MAVIHITGTNEQIKYTEEALKNNIVEEFIKITDFSTAMAKINQRDSFIFPNFVKSQRYQISCKTRQLKIPHLTITFGFSDNLEEPSHKNKFDVPLLRVENELTEKEIEFISECLKRKILKGSRAHFREILTDDYLEKANIIIEACISEMDDLNIENYKYIATEVRNTFMNKLSVNKIDIDKIKGCFTEVMKLELGKNSN
ncbi:hypothetical protein CDIK_1109 [Cucumispora dikerogammari]|nr:hypothetical protein CDIK_1109 [Cucumispora dikerogammari]